MLSDGEIAHLRGLLEAAFVGDPEDAFRDIDWEHAIGGTHVLLELDRTIVAHASVVERAIRVAGHLLRTGYVEAVATAPEHQRTGLGTLVMEEVGALIQAEYQLGALGTGEHGFYERLGWQTWKGPTSVRTPNGEVRTPDEDGYVMVLETPTTPRLDPGDPISCDLRTGDAW